MSVQQPTPGRTSFGPLFRTAMTVGIIWWAGLLGLAVATGNPVSVNYRLIDLSDNVLMGTFNPPDEIDVERDWKRRGPTEIPKGKVSVKNLETISGLKPGSQYVVPVIRMSDGLAVTTDPNPQRTIEPAAYPATPEVLRQLKQILDSLAGTTGKQAPHTRPETEEFGQ